MSREPLIYMAGRMGDSEDNKRPGGPNKCWRLFDVSSIQGDIPLDIQDGTSVSRSLSPLPESRHFYGTNVYFLYSGPWKAMGSYHGYVHGVTSSTIGEVAGKTFDSSLQCISRADIFIAYFDDLEAYGTLVELGIAKAQGKRIIVVTAYPDYAGYEYEHNELTDNIWFAIKCAEKHIHIPVDKSLTKHDVWVSAHKEIAKVIASWRTS